MKLSLTLPILLAAIDGTNGRKSSATKNLIQNSRRVEYNYNYNGKNNGYNNYYHGEADAKDSYYLQRYSLKMLACVNGEKSYNYREGTTETSTVVFRLCPADTCVADNSTSTPCEEGFGDFAVGINTFAEAYVESVKDNYNNGMQYYSSDYGEFNVEEYVKECRLWEDENDNQNQNYDGSYGYQYDYIGVQCTDDGTDIKLASFSDSYCTTESESSFESTHNGYSLPFSDGGMIPSTCMSCSQVNDNYEYELSELCQQVYENANYKCETNMEYSNPYYGPDTRGCDYLESYVPKASKTDFFSSSSKNSEGLFTITKYSSEIYATGYFVLLIVSGLVGAAAVGFYFQKSVTKNAEETETKEASPVVESIKSGAMLVKMAALSMVAKITTLVTKSEPQGEYNNMDERPEEAEC